MSPVTEVHLPKPRKAAGRGRAKVSPTQKATRRLPRTRAGNALRERLGLSPTKLARLTSSSKRNAPGQEPAKGLGRAAATKVKEIGRLVDALERLVGPAVLPEWFRTPNGAFGGLKPLVVIERGELDRLWQMIYVLESGVGA